MSGNDYNTLSINDIIKAYHNCDVVGDKKENILYFISELTGLSIDKICEIENEMYYDTEEEKDL